MRRGLIIGILILTLAGACRSKPTARVVRRFHAAEASQAVAVDAHFFYAIDDAAIGKYEKTTGHRVSGWAAKPNESITHLNSGVVIGRSQDSAMTGARVNCGRFLRLSSAAGKP